MDGQSGEPSANRARLAVAFPEYAAAMWTAGEYGGLQELRDQLKESTPRPALSVVPDPEKD